MTAPAEDSDAVGLRTGRRAAAKTEVHDWVLYSGIAPEAIALYAILRSHVNRSRDDDLVWTTTLTLAVIMDYSRSDKIKKFMDQLVAIKAVDRERSGLHGRNVYTVHQEPPPGYKGPRSGPEWYAMHKDLLAMKRAAEKEVRDARRRKKRAGAAEDDSGDAGSASSEAVTPERGEQPAEGPVTPERGEPVTPERGEPVTPVSGREPKKGFEPPEIEPPTPPTSPPPPEWAVEPEPEQEEKKIYISTGQHTDPADAGPRLTEWELALHAEVLRTRPNWSPSVLREVLVDQRIRERPDPDLVRRAFLIGARTRKTTTPRRLLHDLCPHWQQALDEMRDEAARESGAGQDAPERPARSGAPGAYQGAVGEPAPRTAAAPSDAQRDARQVAIQAAAAARVARVAGRSKPPAAAKMPEVEVPA